MAAVELAQHKRATPSGGPPRWARVIIYSLLWLPAFVLVIGVVPRFEAMFQRLTEKGELPQLTSLLVAFARVDAAYYHLPVVLVALALLALDEAAVCLLRRRSRGNLWSWLWVAAGGVAGLVSQQVIIYGLMLPIYKMGSAVR